MERYHSLLKRDTCSKAGAPAAVTTMLLALAYADDDEYEGLLRQEDDITGGTMTVELAYGPFCWLLVATTGVEMRVDSVVGAVGRGTTVISTSSVVVAW